jgi:class 3 adenylate cyclase
MINNAIHCLFFSILFADIVSFTPLTTALDPSDLVIALNELFGRFDELAQVGRKRE